MTRSELIELAQANGFELRNQTIGKFNSRGHCTLGVTMCQDGTYYRADVKLELANCIRSNVQAARAIGVVSA